MSSEDKLLQLACICGFQSNRGLTTNAQHTFQIFVCEMFGKQYNFLPIPHVSSMLDTWKFVVLIYQIVKENHVV